MLSAPYPERQDPVLESRPVFLRNGRVAADATLAELGAASVPLSLSGLEAFAARRR